MIAAFEITRDTRGQFVAVETNKLPSGIVKRHVIGRRDDVRHARRLCVRHAQGFCRLMSYPFEKVQIMT